MRKTTKIKINLVNLIEIFDERKDKYKGHTTSVIGIIGEDLNAAIFADYLIRRKKAKNVEILPYPVRQNEAQGLHLDRWIKTNNTLYQTEIKSWCSFQVGGYELPLNSTEQKIKWLASKKWERELNEHYKDIKKFGKVSKVLAKMQIPKDMKKNYKKVKPLVIHWMPISKQEATPFFSHPIKKLGMNNNFAKQIQNYFTEVNYFSCSLYIRELINKNKLKDLNLDLPNFNTRMGIIDKLMK